MDWFILNTVKGNKKEKVLLNASSILSVYYNDETNLTIIEVNRSAYPAIYVRGNIMPDIQRLLNSHDHFVSRIGE